MSKVYNAGFYSSKQCCPKCKNSSDNGQGEWYWRDYREENMFDYTCRDCGFGWLEHIQTQDSNEKSIEIKNKKGDEASQVLVQIQKKISLLEKEIEKLKVDSDERNKNFQCVIEKMTESIEHLTQKKESGYW